MQERRRKFYGWGYEGDTVPEKEIETFERAWSRLLGPGVSENGVQFMRMTPEQLERIDGLVRFLMKSPSPPTPPT